MNRLVLGLQWGDEGKGKAINYFANDFDIVVRYQGGHNAGHTIFLNKKKVVLHILPSGVLTKGTLSLIANGVVVNPMQLLEEIEEVENVTNEEINLALSAKAPVIFPFHQSSDIKSEDRALVKIGTTRRGIGPCYEDFYARRSIFVEDLVDEKRLKEVLPILFNYHKKVINCFGGSLQDYKDYIEEYIEAGKKLKKYVIDTRSLLQKAVEDKKNILFEGAQGALLDVCHGTYPFVTSSSPTIGGMLIGTGLSHKSVGMVTGICKAYTTRVGEGPFPSELHCQVGETLRAEGKEFGATTGRPRRVGWLDLPALKYAIEVSGADNIFLTKLDVLDSFEKIELVVSYEDQDGKERGFVNDSLSLSKVKVKTLALSGWQKKISSCRNYSDLPKEAQDYIAYIENYIGIPVKFISVGPNREETLEK